LTIEILLAAVAIAFLAAVCQSLTAFGFALITVPLLSLAWEVKPAVVTSTVLGTLILIPLLYEVRGRVPVRRVIPLFVGSLAGIPLGVLILERIDATALEVVVAVLVIAGSLLIYFSPELRLRRPSPPLALGVGVLSGALRAATSMGGPPIIFYALTLEREVERFRAILLAVFLPTSLVTIAALAAAGRVTGDVLLVSLVAQPAVVVGSLSGRWARTRVSESAFRLVVLALLFVSSAAVLATAVGDLG
jgi:uncharacterized membrane protein YfcA